MTARNVSIPQVNSPKWRGGGPDSRNSHSGLAKVSLNGAGHSSELQKAGLEPSGNFKNTSASELEIKE